MQKRSVYIHISLLIYNIIRTRVASSCVNSGSWSNVCIMCVLELCTMYTWSKVLRVKGFCTMYYVCLELYPVCTRDCVLCICTLSWVYRGLWTMYYVCTRVVYYVSCDHRGLCTIYPVCRLCAMYPVCTVDCVLYILLVRGLRTMYTWYCLCTIYPVCTVDCVLCIHCPSCKASCMLYVYLILVLIVQRLWTTAYFI